MKIRPSCLIVKTKDKRMKKGGAGWRMEGAGWEVMAEGGEGDTASHPIEKK